MFPSHYHGL